jgi:hypothetical protein
VTSTSANASTTAVTASRATATTPAATTTVPGSPVRILNWPIANGEQAAFGRLVEYDPETGCLYSRTNLLVWPPGYAASQDPRGVVDEQGRLVARAGEVLLNSGGGQHPLDDLDQLEGGSSFADCAAKATDLWVIGPLDPLAPA